MRMRQSLYTVPGHLEDIENDVYTANTFIRHGLTAEQFDQGLHYSGRPLRAFLFEGGVAHYCWAEGPEETDTQDGPSPPDGPVSSVGPKEEHMLAELSTQGLDHRISVVCVRS